MISHKKCFKYFFTSPEKTSRETHFEHFLSFHRMGNCRNDHYFFSIFYSRMRNAHLRRRIIHFVYELISYLTACPGHSLFSITSLRRLGNCQIGLEISSSFFQLGFENSVRSWGRIFCPTNSLLACYRTRGWQKRKGKRPNQWSERSIRTRKLKKGTRPRFRNEIYPFAPNFRAARPLFLTRVLVWFGLYSLSSNGAKRIWPIPDSFVFSTKFQLRFLLPELRYAMLVLNP